MLHNASLFKFNLIPALSNSIFNIIGIARISQEYHQGFLRTDKNYNFCINFLKMLFNSMSIYWNIVQHYLEGSTTQYGGGRNIVFMTSPVKLKEWKRLKSLILKAEEFNSVSLWRLQMFIDHQAGRWHITQLKWRLPSYETHLHFLYSHFFNFSCEIWNPP